MLYSIFSYLAFQLRYKRAIKSHILTESGSLKKFGSLLVRYDDQLSFTKDLPTSQSLYGTISTENHRE